MLVFRLVFAIGVNEISLAEELDAISSGNNTFEVTDFNALQQAIGMIVEDLRRVSKSVDSKVLNLSNG